MPTAVDSNTPALAAAATTCMQPQAQRWCCPCICLALGTAPRCHSNTMHVSVSRSADAVLLWLAASLCMGCCTFPAGLLVQGWQSCVDGVRDVMEKEGNQAVAEQCAAVVSVCEDGEGGKDATGQWVHHAMLSGQHRRAEGGSLLQSPWGLDGSGCGELYTQRAGCTSTGAAPAAGGLYYLRADYSSRLRVVLVCLPPSPNLHCPASTAALNCCCLR